MTTNKTSLTCPVHGDKFMDEYSYRCLACLSYNQGNDKVGKRKPSKADKPLPYRFDDRNRVQTDKRGVPTVEALRSFGLTMAKHPERLAELLLETRRPAGVAKERFGVAARKASRTPMINADPKNIGRGLDWYKAQLDERRYSPAKDKVYKRIVVKPTTLQTAKAGRTSAFWGERLWTVFTLKYSKGYIITTDNGETSKRFPTYGELKSAITKSGWEVVR